MRVSRQAVGEREFACFASNRHLETDVAGGEVNRIVRASNLGREWQNSCGGVALGKSHRAEENTDNKN